MRWSTFPFPHVESSGQRLFDGSLEDCQPCRHIGAQVHPQQPPASFRQDLNVSACLCRLHDSERIALSRNRQICRIFAGELEKDPAVRAAFIGLAGGMEEAGTETEARSAK